MKCVGRCEVWRGGKYGVWGKVWSVWALTGQVDPSDGELEMGGGGGARGPVQLYPPMKKLQRMSAQAV